MKKLLSISLILSILVCILPVASFATTDDALLHYDHIALACDIFPEYATILSGEIPSPNARSVSSEPEVIVRETRSIDENTEMTYVQYSNGVAYVATSDFDYTASLINQQTGGGATACTVNLTVDSNISDQTFRANNVNFTIVGQGYDIITYIGSLSSSTTNEAYVSSRRMEESNGSPAYVKYFAQFEPLDIYNGRYTPFEPEIYFVVGSNSYSLRDYLS